MYDVDGNEYIDYICSWGPLLLGHQPETITKAVQEALLKGSTYGAPTALEVEIAKPCKNPSAGGTNPILPAIGSTITAAILFDIMPDLTCLGKIIGGGLPVGAYGGRKEIMEKSIFCCSDCFLNIFIAVCQGNKPAFKLRWR